MRVSSIFPPARQRQRRQVALQQGGGHSRHIQLGGSSSAAPGIGRVPAATHAASQGCKVAPRSAAAAAAAIAVARAGGATPVSAAAGAALCGPLHRRDGHAVPRSGGTRGSRAVQLTAAAGALVRGCGALVRFCVRTHGASRGEEPRQRRWLRAARACCDTVCARFAAASNREEAGSRLNEQRYVRMEHACVEGGASTRVKGLALQPPLPAVDRGQCLRRAGAAVPPFARGARRDCTLCAMIAARAPRVRPAAVSLARASRACCATAAAASPGAASAHQVCLTSPVRRALTLMLTL